MRALVSRCWAAGATCSTRSRPGGARCLASRWCPTRVVADPAAAAEAAAAIGFPVAIKILSPTSRNVRRRRRGAGPRARRRCARPPADMLERVRARPDARIASFTVQAMVDPQVRRAGADRRRQHRPCLRPGDPCSARAARRWRCWPIAPSRCRRSNEPLARAGGAHARRQAAARLPRHAAADRRGAASRADRGVAAAGRHPADRRARHQPADRRRQRRAVALDARIRVSMAARPVR